MAAPSHLLPSRLTHEQLADLLSASVGREKAAELVATSARELGYRAPTVDLNEAVALFDHMATATRGLVCIAARLSGIRLRTQLFNAAYKTSDVA